MARIEKLLSAPTPSYDDLNEAYKLTSGRGMKDEWCEQMLRERPDDKNVRWDMTEKIEAYCRNIERK